MQEFENRPHEQQSQVLDQETDRLFSGSYTALADELIQAANQGNPYVIVGPGNQAIEILNVKPFSRAENTKPKTQNRQGTKVTMSSTYEGLTVVEPGYLAFRFVNGGLAVLITALQEEKEPGEPSTHKMGGLIQITEWNNFPEPTDGKTKKAAKALIQTLGYTLEPGDPTTKGEGVTGKLVLLKGGNPHHLYIETVDPQLLSETEQSTPTEQHMDQTRAAAIIDDLL
jgi:hypothetical protein